MLGHTRLAGFTLCSVGILACGTHSGTRDAGAACQTVGLPPTSQLPHVTVSGATAMAILQALDAIFASQTPPVSPGAAYSLPSLDCSDIAVPGDSGFECLLALGADGGSQIDVSDITASAAGATDAGEDTDAGGTMLAQNLFNALAATVSMPCVDPHGVHVQLQNVSVTASGIQFDDASNYATFEAPNIQVRGPDAQSLISAFAAAGLDDCDPTRNLFIVCNTQGGAPGCGHEWMTLATVGASILEPACGPGGGTQAEPPFDAPTSLAIWNAIIKAASDAGFQPMNGTIAQTTVINADYFTWDGTTLAFLLVADDPTLPPSPPGFASDGGADE
jgi:hypothetical protein